MSKIAFIQDFWHELPGPMTLSAVLKARGHATDIFIGSGAGLTRDVCAFAPDIVAFSVTTGAHIQAAETAARIKEVLPQTIIIAGGPHPTFYPGFLQTATSMDAICRGEGEDALAELADTLKPGAGTGTGASQSQILNLSIKTPDGIAENSPRPPVPDLDDLPLPDYALYYNKYRFLRNNPGKMFLTGRGCPYACTFCFNHARSALYAQHGGYPVRRLSPARAVDMIAWVRRDFGLRHARLDDDVLILDKPWLFSFLEHYRKQIALPFSCLVRANLMTEDIARALPEAGCDTAQFGIESGNETLRNTVLRKGVTNDHIIQAADLLRRNGIRTGTFNMMNLPGETLENGWETVALNRRIRAQEPWCALTQPYPGTRLERLATEQGLLPADFSPDQIPTSYFRNSPIRNPDRAALENLHKFFYLAVKAPALTPLIRRLVRLPANPLFDLIFKITYARRFGRVYRTPLTRVLAVGRKNKKQY